MSDTKTITLPESVVTELRDELKTVKGQVAALANGRANTPSPASIIMGGGPRGDTAEKNILTRDYLRAVIGKDVDSLKRLRNEYPAFYGVPTAEQKANWNETTNGNGLYAVPDVWNTEIFTAIEEHGYVRNLYRNIALTKKNELFTTLAAFTAAAFTAEGAAATLQSGDSMLGRATVTANHLKAALLWTEELEADEFGGLIAELTNQLGADIARVEDTVGIKGDVSGAGDAFNGLLFQTFNASYTVTMAATKTAFSNVSWTHMVELQNKGLASTRRNAVFLVPQAVYTTLRTETDENNRPIWDNERPGDLTGHTGLDALKGSTHWTPNGTPMVVVPDALWISSAAGKTAAVYGNFQRYALMGQRKALEEKTFNEYYGSTSLSGHSKVLELSERIAFGFPNMDGFACLKTAAS